MELQSGDRVYYHHKDARGYDIKSPAIVLAINEDIIRVRVGCLDVMTQRTKTFEEEVSADSLSQRRTPCSFEKDIAG